MRTIDDCTYQEYKDGVFGAFLLWTAAVRFIDDIYKEACKWAQPISIKEVEYVPSTLSGHAGLIGAAYLAIKNKTYEQKF